MAKATRRWQQRGEWFCERQGDDEREKEEWGGASVQVSKREKGDDRARHVGDNNKGGIETGRDWA